MNFDQPQLPTPNFADALWDGCAFAVCCGGVSGYDQDTKETAADSLSGIRGELTGSVSGTIGIEDMGRVIGSGLSDDEIDWDDPNDYWDIPSNTGFSAAVLCRPIDASPSGDKIWMGKRAATGTAFHGWYLGMEQSGPKWECEYSDGFSIDLESTTTPSVNRTDLVGVTLDRGAVGGDMRLFINGAEENQRNTTTSVGNNNEPMRFMGGNSTDEADGWVGMGAFWKTPLAAQGHADLHVDPYRMWKPYGKDFMWAGLLSQSAFQTYFLCF